MPIRPSERTVAEPELDLLIPASESVAGSSAGRQVSSPERLTPSTLLLVLAVLAPAVICFTLIAHFQIDIPYLDDYFAILGFANHLQSLGTPADRLSWMLAAQHVDYKLVFLHVVVGVQLWLSHRIDFTVLNAIGNSFLLWTGVLLWKTYFRGQSNLTRRLLLFLPISLLWFSINYAEALDWAAGSLLYQPVIFFSLLSLYLLAAPGGRTAPRPSAAPLNQTRFALACLAAAAACLTAINGALLGPIGLAVLLVRRQFGRSLLWCTAIALALFPYVYRYTPVPHAFKQYPVRMISFVLIFAGNGLPSYKLALAAGIVLTGAFFWAACTGYASTNLAAVLGAVWLLGSAAMVAYGRSHSGLEFAHISRYKLFSDLLFVFAYGFWAEHLLSRPRPVSRPKLLYTVVLLVSALFFVRNSILGAKVLGDQRDLLTGNARFYWQDPVHRSPMHHDRPDLTRFWAPFAIEEKLDLEDSMRRGIYVLPGGSAEDIPPSHSHAPPTDPPPD